MSEAGPSVPAEVVALERAAKAIRRASDTLVDADAFDRWGPRNDDAQREAIERDAAEATRERDAAVAELAARVPALRRASPTLIHAWVDAHVALLDDYLARVAADSTEASVARKEREQWRELAAGTRDRVRQNGHFVHYDDGLYRELFGFGYY